MIRPLQVIWMGFISLPMITQCLLKLNKIYLHLIFTLFQLWLLIALLRWVISWLVLMRTGVLVTISHSLIMLLMMLLHLQKLIEKAKALQGKDMIPGALTALNNAITTAEGATADATSITALGQAISAANTAITEMSTFKAGDYKTLAAIESPDEIASFVLDTE